MAKDLSYFIKQNLRYRPRFFAYIRPQEAVLFEQNKKYIKGKVMDFGCGDGFFAETIFGKKRIDVGLDVPTSRMATAQKNNVYKELVTYDGVVIPAQDASVGTVISNCVFEHVPHIKKSVEEMRRVLRPGGHLLTSVMCNSWSDNLDGGKLLGSPYVHWFNTVQEHNSLFSKKQWIALFKKAGFEIIVQKDYLYEKSAKKTELYHFLSLPSLFLFKLTGKWTLGLSPQEKEVDIIRSLIEDDKELPSACFFVLKKASNYY